MKHRPNKPKLSHATTLFILVEQYFPVKGKQDAILRIARESAKSIEGLSGLVMTQVLRPTTQSGPVCNISTWESEAAFKTFMKSDAVKELYASETMANVKAWTSNIEIEMFTLEDGWHQ